MKNLKSLTDAGKRFLSKKDLHKSPFVATTFSLKDEGKNETAAKKDNKSPKNS